MTIGHLNENVIKMSKKIKRCGHTVFSTAQKARLVEAFQHAPYLSLAMRQQLAQELGLSEKKISDWFKNHRTNTNTNNTKIYFKKVQNFGRRRTIFTSDQKKLLEIGTRVDPQIDGPTAHEVAKHLKISYQCVLAFFARARNARRKKGEILNNNDNNPLEKIEWMNKLKSYHFSSTQCSSSQCSSSQCSSSQCSSSQCSSSQCSSSQCSSACVPETQPQYKQLQQYEPQPQPQYEQHQSTTNQQYEQQQYQHQYQIQYEPQPQYQQLQEYQHQHQHQLQYEPQSQPQQYRHQSTANQQYEPQLQQYQELNLFDSFDWNFNFCN